MGIVKRLGTAAAALALLAAVPAAAQDPAGLSDDRVVAVVNGSEIRMSDVLEGIQELPPQYRQMPPQVLFDGVLQQVINRHLMSEQGYEAGLQSSEEVVRRLAAVERRLVQEAWIMAELESRLTDERLREDYEEAVAALGEEDEVRARHILLESEEEAREAIARLDAGEDFVELAQELSTGPSAGEGGDLGYFTEDVMVEPFARAAFALEVGAHSADPVETQFGWHVILVEDRRRLEPPSFEEVRAELMQNVQQEIIREIIAELRESSQITQYDLEGNEIPAEPAQP